MHFYIHDMIKVWTMQKLDVTRKKEKKNMAKNF